MRELHLRDNLFIGWKDLFFGSQHDISISLLMYYIILFETDLLHNIESNMTLLCDTKFRMASTIFEKIFQL